MGLVQLRNDLHEKIKLLVQSKQTDYTTITSVVNQAVSEKLERIGPIEEVQVEESTPNQEAPLG